MSLRDRLWIWIALGALVGWAVRTAGGGVLLTTRRGEVEIVRDLAEKYHAKTEVRLWDGTRVDMLNDTYAIECDFSRKWAEAVGQSLYYAELTHRKPMIVLLVRDLRKEQAYVYRAQTVCARQDIRLRLEIVQ